MSDLVKLEHILGIKFRDEAVYKEALTHKSFAAEHQLSYDNQRLELLGDAVVQIILTDYLYRRYTDLQEGDLTKIRSAMVNQDALAQFARGISLGSFLMLGRGELELNGQDRDSTISDAFESLIGAIYLDHGLEVATDLFLSILLKTYPDPAESLHEINPKGILQEYTQQKSQGVPQYRIVAVTGPAVVSLAAATSGAVSAAPDATSTSLPAVFASNFAAASTVPDATLEFDVSV